MLSLSPRACRLSLPAVAVAALVAGCNGDGGTLPVPAPPVAVNIVTGDDQQGVVGQELPQALVVRVVDAAGKGVAGQAVAFVVTSGGGSVFAGAAVTNQDGQAQERWTLGTSTATAQSVEARAVDSRTGEKLVFATFHATPLPAAPASLSKFSGDAQSAAAGSQLSQMPTVRVVDRYGNLVPGATVTWSAQGGGSAAPAQSQAGSDGLARTTWTLGTTVGSQSLTATAGGQTVSFTANATQAPPANKWTAVASPTTATLNDVWGTSATNVWAVGDGGTVVHYDGTAWSVVAGATTARLVRVWGTSPSNVYAISDDDATLIHFNGSSWAATSAPPKPTGLATGRGGPTFWVNSPSDAIAIVNSPFVSALGDSIMHWDGSSWTAQVRNVRSASAVWMAPDGRAVVGQSEVTDRGYFYDGATWQPWGSVFAGRSMRFRGKTFGDLFVLANSSGSCCTVKHFDGSALDFTSYNTAPYEGAWWVSPDEIYIWTSPGTDATGYTLARTTAANSVATAPEGISGKAMWGASATDLFVVGAGGKIYRRTP